MATRETVSQFGFPETLIEVEGRQNRGASHLISVLLYRPYSKIEKTPEKNDLLDAIAYTGRARKIERLPNQSFSLQLTKNIDSTKVVLVSSNS